MENQTNQSGEQLTRLSNQHCLFQMAEDMFQILNNTNYLLVSFCAESVKQLDLPSEQVVCIPGEPEDCDNKPPYSAENPLKVMFDQGIPYVEHNENRIYCKSHTLVSKAYLDFMDAIDEIKEIKEEQMDLPFL